uniref:LRRCT domain-containing protein n=1 Tax=Poecilia reticulata TaxID=8081 RepID=A0A3P9NJE3_POERE
MKLLLLVTFIALAEFDYKRSSAYSCPDRCSCSSEPSAAEVVCSKGGLTDFPRTGFPANTTLISIQSTHLSSVTAGDLSAVPFLNKLQLYHTNLANLSSDLLVSVSHLDTLDLTGNKLAKLPANTLDLDGNSLQELHADVFRNLHHLETLNLAGNKLITLKPQLFAHNLQLKYLYLQENQLQDLPVNLLHRLQNLELLLLNQNQLRHLPAGLLDGVNPSVQIILTGNPWECDGKMEYLWKWLTSHRQNVLFETEVTCDNPKALKNQQVSSLTDSQLGVRLQ